MGMRIRISVIAPKDYLKDVNFQSIIARKQRNTTAPDLIRMFSGTVDGWAHKPVFDWKQIVNSSRIQINVGPKGVFGGSNKALNIYRLVSLGSPPHDIPKTAFKRKFMTFRTGYVSSTRAGSLSSNRRSYSGPFVSARQVNHPGFDAREFDTQISKIYKDKFESDMQEAMAEAVR